MAMHHRSLLAALKILIWTEGYSKDLAEAGEPQELKVSTTVIWMETEPQRDQWAEAGEELASVRLER